MTAPRRQSGPVFCCAGGGAGLGTGAEVYLGQAAAFREHVLGGILTAARRVPASRVVNDKPDDVPDYRPPELENCENQILF